MSENTKNQYEDIIHLPHHVSTTRPHMSYYDRAAQFAPFAALTGHDAAVKETARLTNERVELDEETKQILDKKLQMIRSSLSEGPEIIVTYFVPDEHKEGGSYLTVSGKVTKIDEYKHMIHLDGVKVIPIQEIYGIDGTLFEGLEDSFI